MDIGERIKFCRKHRGMTQDRLAEETGIHPVSIRKYETGKMVPKPEQIERIAKAINVTYSAISGDYDVVFPVGRFPEVISLLMMLFHSGIITIEGEKNGEQKIEPSTAKMKVNPSIARFFNVESPNAKIALEQGWLTANDPRIMNFFSEYEAVVSAYEQAVREGKEHPSEEQEQVIQQRKQKMEKTQMLMQLKPLVLPMDFDYDIETDGDYDPEDYGPVFAEMLEEKRKRQRNPEEKNEKSTM